MDLKIGEYILFDEVASDMWLHLLSAPDFNFCLSAIAHKYGIDPTQCENDLLEFMSSCKERELVTTTEIIEDGSIKVHIKRKSANLFTAWNCIRSTRKTLQRVEFPALYERYSQFLKPENNPINDSYLASALDAFRKAENFFSVTNDRFDCLPRSLSLFRFLLSIGISCDHCIGIRRFPFGAHAWVEAQNKVVGDDDSHITKFSVINRI